MRSGRGVIGQDYAFAVCVGIHMIDCAVDLVGDGVSVDAVLSGDDKITGNAGEIDIPAGEGIAGAFGVTGSGCRLTVAYLLLIQYASVPILEGYGKDRESSVLKPSAVHIVIKIICCRIVRIDKAGVGVLKPCGIGRDLNVVSGALVIAVERAAARGGIEQDMSCAGGCDGGVDGGRKHAAYVRGAVDGHECGCHVSAVPRAASVCPAWRIDDGGDPVAVAAVAPGICAPFVNGDHIKLAAVHKVEGCVFAYDKTAVGGEFKLLVGE